MSEGGNCSIKYLLSVWSVPLSFLVFPTRPRRVTDDHEAVLALVGHDRLVRDCRVHSFPVNGTVWYRTLDGHASRELGRGPRAVALNQGQK
jgi:hypothetical protein